MNIYGDAPREKLGDQTVRVIDRADEEMEVSSAPVHIFVIGCKGIPAAYGGFETFVDKLTEYRKSDRILYHVARLSHDERRFVYHDSIVFDISVPEIGPSQAIYYDLAAVEHCLAYCRRNPQIREPIFYILACRIGPFIGRIAREIHALGGHLLINPDGHEWKRTKWSGPIRLYWKLSEGMMVRRAELLVCDSRNIEGYILQEYAQAHPETTYIAYGSETRTSPLPDDDPAFLRFLRRNHTAPGRYYLVVGRFVPENNYETMIREFMRSKSSRKLLIITTKNPQFTARLERRLHFSQDPRIVFAGTVYNQGLLKKIRENAYGYLHGHEVGGTNPSLLEALGSTKLNLLLNVGFNKEVGDDAALYWDKKRGSLSTLIDRCDRMPQAEREGFGRRALERICSCYSWEAITERYEKTFFGVLQGRED